MDKNNCPVKRTVRWTLLVQTVNMYSRVGLLPSSRLGSHPFCSWWIQYIRVIIYRKKGKVLKVQTFRTLDKLNAHPQSFSRINEDLLPVAWQIPSIGCCHLLYTLYASWIHSYPTASLFIKRTTNTLGLQLTPIVAPCCYVKPSTVLLEKFASPTMTDLAQSPSVSSTVKTVCSKYTKFVSCSILSGHKGRLEILLHKMEC